MWSYCSKKSDRKNRLNEINDGADENEDEVLTVPQSTEALLVLQLLDKSGYVKQRTRAKIIRYVNYGEFVDPENFYREIIMLYSPWRDERKDITNQNCEEIYRTKAAEIEKVRIKFDKRIDLPEIVEDREQVQNLEKAEYTLDDEYEVLHNYDFKDHSDQDFEECEKIQKLRMPKMLSDNAFKILIRNLNEKQSKYLQHVMEAI